MNKVRSSLDFLFLWRFQVWFPSFSPVGNVNAWTWPTPLWWVNNHTRAPLTSGCSAASSVDSLSSPTRTTWPSLPWRPSASRPERWAAVTEAPCPNAKALMCVCVCVCVSDPGCDEPGQRRPSDAAAGGRRHDLQPAADAAAGRHPEHPRGYEASTHTHTHF